MFDPREVSVIPINSQPIEKAVKSDGLILDVHSIFYTLQGEGPFTGHPAVFIRLAGCNLQCPSCDTSYTEGRQTQSFQEIIRRVWIAMDPDNNYHLPLVVITGGEPFRQNIAPLVRALIVEHFKVQIETNGTLGLPDDFLLRNGLITIVCSPKAGKIHKNIEPFVDAFKYVMSADSVDPHDGLPTLALNHTASPRVARPPEGFNGPIYLQPMDPGQRLGDMRLDNKPYNANVQACVASCMKYGYIMQLQTHKILGLE